MNINPMKYNFTGICPNDKTTAGPNTNEPSNTSSASFSTNTEMEKVVWVFFVAIILHFL